MDPAKSVFEQTIINEHVDKHDVETGQVDKVVEYFYLVDQDSFERVEVADNYQVGSTAHNEQVDLEPGIVSQKYSE